MLQRLINPQKPLNLPLGGGERTNTLIKTNSTDSTTKSKDTYLTLEPDSNPKTGGFIGAEVGISSSYNGMRARVDIVEPNTGAIMDYFHFYDSKNSVVFPINLMGGYQWYFYNRPWFHLGVAIKAHIGYTNYNEEFEDYRSDGRWWASEVTAHGIQYGLEAKFLWDFLNKGNHSLGVSVAPLGFEGSSIIYNEKYDFGSLNTYEDRGKQYGRAEKGTKTTFTYTFSGGLHYYYNINHQLFVYYKYRFYSDIITGKTGYAFAPSHTLMTGYAYKF